MRLTKTSESRRLGIQRPAALSSVALGPAILVTTVSVTAPTVFPGTVVAAPLNAKTTVLPLTTLVAEVASAKIVDGGIVVPDIVVVYVISCPRAVAGIALPLPEAVYCVGIGKVAVSGLEGESDAP